MRQRRPPTAAGAPDEHALFTALQCRHISVFMVFMVFTARVFSGSLIAATGAAQS